MEPYISHEDAQRMLNERNDLRTHEFISPRSKLIALLFCALFGISGAHRFYAGRKLSAFFMLLTFGYFGLGVIWDFLLIFFNLFRDGKYQKIKNWLPRRHSGEVFSISLTTIFLTFFLGSSYLTYQFGLPLAFETIKPILEKNNIQVDKKAFSLAFKTLKNIREIFRDEYNPETIDSIKDYVTEKYEDIDPRTKREIKEQAKEILERNKLEKKISDSFEDLSDSWKKSRIIAPSKSKSKSKYYSSNQDD